MNARATEFEVIPAIDLLDGRAVRLAQGRYEDATVYDDRPALVAGRFVAAGATRIHVVDLDGAKAGRPVNGVAIRKVVSAAGRVPVQLGGGLRTLAAVESALELDVDRVILGTAALRDPDLVRDAARRFPGRIVVGIDAKDGRVAVEGWLEADPVWTPAPGSGHAAILGRLVTSLDLRGNLVSDAVLAALCIEHGLDIVSADSDFARFTEVTWINPVAA